MPASSRIENKLFGKEGYPGYDNGGVSVYFNRGIQHPRVPAWTVPRLKMGKVSDLKLAKPVTFTDAGQSYTRQDIKEMIVTSLTLRRIPTYLMGDHQYMFFGGIESADAHKIRPPVILVHIDRHSDTAAPATLQVDTNSLSNVHRYTVDVLHSDQFIYPLLHTGMVSEVLFVSPYMKGEQLEKRRGTATEVAHTQLGIENARIREIIAGGFPFDKVWLDIDLDYFAKYLQDGTAGSNLLIARDIKYMQALIMHAGVITVATSPGWIDEEKAIQYAQHMLSPFSNP